MKLLDFIFLHRNWAKDKKKFGRRLRRLFYGELPVSLVVFPEGTTICEEAVEKSNKFADENRLPHPVHTLVPRITGLQYALECIGEHVDGIWDITIGYDDVPKDEYPENVFGLVSLFGHKHAPSVIHFHLRYFPISHIPFRDPEAFKEWLYKTFTEKEKMMNEFQRKGKFSGPSLASFKIAPPMLIYSLYWVIPLASLVIYFVCRYIYLRYFI